MSAYNHEIIYQATKEQLQEVVEDWLHAVKKTDPEMHQELECDLYEKVRGQHFDRRQYDKAMENRPYQGGKQTPKWTVEQVSDYARRQGDRFERYNEYDLAYEMNRLYDAYNGTIGENHDTYYRMARNRIDDRNEPEGRAWRDYKNDVQDRRQRDRMGRYADGYGRTVR